MKFFKLFQAFIVMFNHLFVFQTTNTGSIHRQIRPLNS